MGVWVVASKERDRQSEGTSRAKGVSEYMKLPEFYKIVARNAGTTLDGIAEFVDAFEEEMLNIFWTEDSLKLKIGTFKGITKKGGVYKSNKPPYDVIPYPDKEGWPKFVPSKEAKERFIVPEFTPTPIDPDLIFKAAEKELLTGEVTKVLPIPVPEDYPPVPRVFLPDSNSSKEAFLRGLEKILKKSKERKKSQENKLSSWDKIKSQNKK